MAQTPLPLVKQSADGQSFTITMSLWSGTYRLDALPRQLNFYRNLRDRKKGAYAKHYELTVRALEEFARKVH